MRSALEAVKAPESPIEIRVINTRNDGPCRLFANTYNGFYDDVDAAVRDISRITGRDAAGVYMTINPLDDIVRNWGHNRLAKANKAADDNCVVRLRHLFIDIDPLRPSSTNATADEHASAMQLLDEVTAYLVGEEGWPPPVLSGSSGSGGMALWRVDLPVEQVDYLGEALQGLHAKFQRADVKIDTSVSNPARLIRVPGTVNAKAPTPQPNRPWALATAQAGGVR